ncbi:Pycsar system effector family protein [Actinoplanes sp. G11-F43]|uniref:Pycsar system effector family protein n=1 Tax=Actinoplanes sp. G11-F43 TaxID=3424130 RepID=UPI003D33E76F
MHTTPEQTLAPLPHSADLDDLVDETDAVVLTLRLDAETATLRMLEPRVDTKAGTLLSLSSGLLVAALTLLGTGKLPAAAAATVGIAALLLGAAVLALTAALRPNVGASFGFVRWARIGSDTQLVAELAAAPVVDSLAGCTERAAQLRWLSASLLGKFSRLRTAQSLLVAALAVGMVAAVLSAIGR